MAKKSKKLGFGKKRAVKKTRPRKRGPAKKKEGSQDFEGEARASG